MCSVTVASALSPGAKNRSGGPGTQGPWKAWTPIREASKVRTISPRPVLSRSTSAASTPGGAVHSGQQVGDGDAHALGIVWAEVLDHRVDPLRDSAHHGLAVPALEVQDDGLLIGLQDLK